MKTLQKCLSRNVFTKIVQEKKQLAQFYSCSMEFLAYNVLELFQ